MPVRVVAPTSVNGGIVKRMLDAAGPVLKAMIFLGVTKKFRCRKGGNAIQKTITIENIDSKEVMLLRALL